MAVAQDIIGTEQLFSGASSPQSITLTGVSASTTAIHCWLWTSSAMTTQAVVWDSGGAAQSLTQIGTDVVISGGSVLQLWGLSGASGTIANGGSKLLTLSWVGGAFGIHINGASYTGTETTFANAFTHFNSNTGTSSAPSLTVTGGTSRDIVVEAASTTGILSLPLQSQLWIDNTGALGLCASQVSPGSSPANFGWTGTGNWGEAGVVITAPAVGPTVNRMGSIYL